MELNIFAKMKTDFSSADVESKIKMYVEAEGLTREQYRELLSLFPISDLHKLEEALG